MLHYTHVDYKGRRVKRSKEIAVGDLVRSRYRAQWVGVVEALDGRGMAMVRQVLDRRGVPIRKPRTVNYHCEWFTVLQPQEAINNVGTCGNAD